MAQFPATVTPCAEPASLPPAESRLRAEREQLTHLLRAVASELDDLDRRLSDIAWRLSAQHTHPVRNGVDREQAVLAIQRDRLNARLRSLAGRLQEIDRTLSGPSSAAPQSVQSQPIHVGTCPDCGYPSLGSGLCASCRLYLVR